MKITKSFIREVDGFKLTVEGIEKLSAKLDDFPVNVQKAMAIYGLTKKLQDKFDTLKIEKEPGTVSQRIDACEKLVEAWKNGEMKTTRSFICTTLEEEAIVTLEGMGFSRKAAIATIKVQRTENAKKEEVEEVEEVVE